MKIITAIIALLLIITSSAFAAPRYTAAKQQAEKIKKDERELIRRIRRLSSSEQERLKRAIRGTDSDGDTVSDVIEGALGSSRCDADSDDDGLDDSDDTDEDDADSDDDGFGDATEVRAKGTITAYVDPNLTVQEKTFSITDATTFRGISRSSLATGICVKVEGHTLNGDNIADTIKESDDC